MRPMRGERMTVETPALLNAPLQAADLRVLAPGAGRRLCRRCLRPVRGRRSTFFILMGLTPIAPTQYVVRHRPRRQWRARRVPDPRHRLGDRRPRRRHGGGAGQPPASISASSRCFPLVAAVPGDPRRGGGERDARSRPRQLVLHPDPHDRRDLRVDCPGLCRRSRCRARQGSDRWSRARSSRRARFSSTIPTASRRSSTSVADGRVRCPACSWSRRDGSMVAQAHVGSQGEFPAAPAIGDQAGRRAEDRSGPDRPGIDQHDRRHRQARRL